MNKLKEFIPVSKPSISQKEIDYVSKAVQSGWSLLWVNILIDLNKNLQNIVEHNIDLN